MFQLKTKPTYPNNHQGAVASISLFPFRFRNLINVVENGKNLCFILDQISD
jgi:hypothetical protein